MDERALGPRRVPMNFFPSSVVATARVHGPTWRVVAALALVAGEVALALRTLDFDHLRGADVWWAEPMRLLSHNAPWAACVAAVALLAGFGRWRAAGERLVASTGRPHVGLEALAALVLHAACGLSFAALSQLVIAGGSTIDWLHTSLPFFWFANGALLVASAGLAAVPLERWRAALAPLWRALVAGGIVGTALFWLARFVDGNYFLWGPLADVTLATSAALLELVADDVHLEQDTRILGVGAFRVIVSKYCSGLEGLALFGLFFASFMTLLRARLRIARAVWLLPAGMLVVWSLNAVRIAALVALGAFHDPQLAVDAFHTHAGWPPLVAVALGCVALTTRVRWFASVGASGAAGVIAAPLAAVEHTPTRERDGTSAYLLPLLAVVATGLVAGAFLDHGANSAPLRVLVGAALLWRVRAALPGRGDVRALLAATRSALLSPAVWLFTAAALALWIVCDTTRGTEGAPPAWLANAHPLAAAAFWCAAFASYAVVTPLVEELAFRGYAQRRLVSARFEEVPLTKPAPWALLVSALAFGALHGNFVGGVLVAIVFSLAAARRGRLADAVAVHALVNAILAVVAVVTGRWGFWF